MAIQIANQPPGIHFASNKKMLNRSIPNPLDRATVVSIFPMAIDESKPTIFPGRFAIEKGAVDDPKILVVGPSSWFREMPNDEPILEVPNSAIQIADSIIKDYCNGLLGCDMGEKRPGLFFVPGEKTLLEIKSSFKAEIVKANVRQKAWFAELVKLGDSLWARSNNNPLVIWDLMRIAAKDLGLDKPWVADFTVVEKVKCMGCGNLRDPKYPICASCKMIDQSHPLAKDIKFAV